MQYFPKLFKKKELMQLFYVQNKATEQIWFYVLPIFWMQNIGNFNLIKLFISFANFRLIIIFSLNWLELIWEYLGDLREMDETIS